MGLLGVDGSFRNASQSTLQVLRKHKQTLMHLLEAFLYDPLVDWIMDRSADDFKRQMELNASLRACLATVDSLQRSVKDYLTVLTFNWSNFAALLDQLSTLQREIHILQQSISNETATLLALRQQEHELTTELNLLSNRLNELKAQEETQISSTVSNGFKSQLSDWIAELSRQEHIHGKAFSVVRDGKWLQTVVEVYLQQRPLLPLPQELSHILAMDDGMLSSQVVERWLEADLALARFSIQCEESAKRCVDALLQYRTWIVQLPETYVTDCYCVKFIQWLQELLDLPDVQIWEGIQRDMFTEVRSDQLQLCKFQRQRLDSHLNRLQTQIQGLRTFLASEECIRWQENVQAANSAVDSLLTKSELDSPLMVCGATCLQLLYIAQVMSDLISDPLHSALGWQLPGRSMLHVYMVLDSLAPLSRQVSGVTEHCFNLTTRFSCLIDELSWSLVPFSDDLALPLSTLRFIYESIQNLVLLSDHSSTILEDLPRLPVEKAICDLMSRYDSCLNSCSPNSVVIQIHSLIVSVESALSAFVSCVLSASCVDRSEDIDPSFSRRLFTVSDEGVSMDLVQYLFIRRVDCMTQLLELLEGLREGWDQSVVESIMNQLIYDYTQKIILPCLTCLSFSLLLTVSNRFAEEATTIDTLDLDSDSIQQFILTSMRHGDRREETVALVTALRLSVENSAKLRLLWEELRRLERRLTFQQIKLNQFLWINDPVLSKIETAVSTVSPRQTILATLQTAVDHLSSLELDLQRYEAEYMQSTQDLIQQVDTMLHRVCHELIVERQTAQRALRDRNLEALRIGSAILSLESFKLGGAKSQSLEQTVRRYVQEAESKGLWDEHRVTVELLKSTRRLQTVTAQATSIAQSLSDLNRSLESTRNTHMSCCLHYEGLGETMKQFVTEFFTVAKDIPVSFDNVSPSMDNLVRCLELAGADSETTSTMFKQLQPLHRRLMDQLIPTMQEYSTMVADTSVDVSPLVHCNLLHHAESYAQLITTFRDSLGSMLKQSEAEEAKRLARDGAGATNDSRSIQLSEDFDDPTTLHADDADDISSVDEDAASNLSQSGTSSQDSSSQPVDSRMNRGKGSSLPDVALRHQTADGLEAPTGEARDLGNQPGGASERSAYALSVLRRVRAKLDGVDNVQLTLAPTDTLPLTVAQQVDAAIRTATSVDSLAVMYEGWTAWI
eukprot:GILJ01011380.1.p1 GENE.GILJ01011380.1~~GILJ01011380.1.p1  ORF type:complete len:1236 (+),score=189.19 GILJ01011380.1:159-3710(+)